MGSQESRFLPLPKHDHPPFSAAFFAIHSKALLTLGWDEYPNLTRARAVLPTTQRWLRFEPSMPNPPSLLANFLIHSRQALAVFRLALVRPRSESISSIQLVERYFGVYSLSPEAHQPALDCFARISAAHPLFGMAAWASATSGSRSGRSRRCFRARYLMDGCSGCRSQPMAPSVLTGPAPRVSAPCASLPFRRPGPAPRLRPWV